MSHKSWCLNTTTLKQLYISLVRSVIEYSSFLLPVLSEKLINTLKVIENNSLRVILHKKLSDKISIEDLHQMASIERIETRLENLRKVYFRKAAAHKKPLIAETILDHFKYTIFSQKKRFDSLLDNLDLDFLMELMGETIQE